MDMSSIREFTSDLGDFATEAQSRELLAENKKEREKKGQKIKDYTMSQFFGKDKIEPLLHDTGDACVGLKITLILDADGKEELLIQAVDKDGKVLPIRSMEKTRSLSGGAEGVYGGPRCPKICLPPPDKDE